MVYFIICIGIIILDFCVKYWARLSLSQVNTIPLWENVFHFTYVENRGAAFGILQNQRLFFLVLGIVALIVIGYATYKYKNRSLWMSLGLTFLSAGAVGNMIDRIFLGYVVDFLDFRLIDFPVFNIADIFVCTGAAMVAIFIVFIEEKQKKEQTSDES